MGLNSKTRSFKRLSLSGHCSMERSCKGIARWRASLYEANVWRVEAASNLVDLNCIQQLNGTERPWAHGSNRTCQDWRDNVSSLAEYSNARLFSQSYAASCPRG